MFSFLRSPQTLFYSDGNVLHSHQQCVKVLTSQFLTNTHCSFNLHFSRDWWCWASFHLLAVYISPLEKCLFKTFTHFLVELSCSCWVGNVLYIFLMVDPYQICDLQILSSILRVAIQPDDFVQTVSTLSLINANSNFFYMYCYSVFIFLSYPYNERIC